MLHATHSRPLPAAAETARVPQILLVAGPSGGGKSTFIRLLRERRLGRDILAALPEACWQWPVVEANNMLKQGLSLNDMLAGAGSADGVILHYDIAYIHRFALAGYESDPASELFSFANRLDAVLVKADLDRLTRQHRARHHAQMSSKSRAKRIWGDWIRRPLRKLNLRLRGQTAIDTQALYLTPDFLSACYGAWEAYVRRLALAKSASRMLTVAPDQDADGAPLFRLVPARP